MVDKASGAEVIGEPVRGVSSATRGLEGKVAVVTGASSGIGRAIALALSKHGADLCLVGRDPARLAGTAAAARKNSGATEFQIDLRDEHNLRPLLLHLEKHGGRLDILVHSAGVIQLDRMESATRENFDLQYHTNVRSPYMITQRLLPFLAAARGQIVFINSSVGMAAKRPEVGQYAATKHALKAIADSLREEVNPKGVRVLTLYLGRTATPMQEALYRREGRSYHPACLLKPEDVASLVVQAVMLPPTAEVTDISMRPLQKSY